MEILRLSDVSFTYAGCDAPAITDISLSLEEGEFLVLCGDTGSGKSTLIRLMKRELTPMGERTGEIRYMGEDIDALSPARSASEIGFVMQRPEQQLVTDKVWHELSFGLENLGCPPGEMRRRVAETAQFFGIEKWFDRDTDELSGGQKQLLNLAAVTVMRPKLLILDEPTSRLDPIAAGEFLGAVSRLNREMGMTVILVEHRLEDALPLGSRMLVLEKGRVILCDDPRTTCAALRTGDPLLLSMPAAVRLYHAAPAGESCPLTVREGRDWLHSHYAPAVLPPEPEYVHPKEPALELDSVSFRYARSAPDVLSDTSLTVYRGEIFCILGGNGSGKTTALRTAAGLLRPYSGSVRIFGKKAGAYPGNSLYENCLAMLPQDVQTVLLRASVREELKDAGVKPEELPYDLTHLLDRHPYDLSGGEQQLVALAKVLAAKPKLLLLDEPTVGIDAGHREILLDILRKLRSQGVTVIIVTHDPELAARCADRCALFFRGSVTALDTPRKFFSGNSFYTTAVDRICRDTLSGCVTLSDAVSLLSAQKGDGK